MPNTLGQTKVSSVAKGASSHLRRSNDMASESKPTTAPVPKYRRYERDAEFDPELNGRSDDASLDDPCQIQDKVARLQQLYDQGVPFFSKSVIRDLVSQLDECRANGSHPNISIPSINGTVIKFILETGDAECLGDSEDEDIEFVTYCFPSPRCPR